MGKLLAFSLYLEAASAGSVAGSQAAAGLEESLGLCPIEDRRGLDSTRDGNDSRLFAGELRHAK
jgi:hypothetical protein